MNAKPKAQDVVTVDPWDHWRRRVAGERVAVHERWPQTGYYCWTQKIDRPVAIFQRNDEWIAVVGNVEGDLTNQFFANAEDIWTWCKPIPQEVYDAVARDGQSFTSAAISTPTKRPQVNGDGRAWREAKARIIEAASKGVGVRLTAEECAEAANEWSTK